jgi:isoleucyl-tRNA synthetase
MIYKNMNDYKDTLNLPATDFPMKANLSQREPEILQRWLKLDLYKRLRQKAQGKPRFIFHDGPPYANARPHLGTALNKILKDIVVKSKILSGFDTAFVPGWDCHGLPIELNVEKKIGKISDKLSAKEFRRACREYAISQIAMQLEDFQRLGVIADWQLPYLTMNFQYEADTVRALAQIIANGHLQRGQKPVYWCTACGSALADTEVEYQDKSSPAIDVAFAVVEPQIIADLFQCDVPSEPIWMPIWTTTPWTLPANQAVAVNADFSYVLIIVEWKNKTIALIGAEKLADSMMKRYGVANYQIKSKINGEALEGLKLRHPYLDRIVPVILADHVTLEAGTGSVHTAPAHGQEDYVVGQQYRLPMDNPVEANGCFNSQTPLVAGLHVFKANDIILDELAKKGTLLHHENLQHSYPHCWRHKIPVIYRATPQWFISMDQQQLRNQALAEVEQVNWLPVSGKNRISRMLENRPDWCISRQRVWGVPIPFFIHKQTGELHPQTLELMEKVALVIEKQGVEGWFDLNPQQLIGQESQEYFKSNDILDVWFDSGVSHFSVLMQRPELGVPADLYFEGSDQHRGWFQTSLLTAVAMRGKAPYRTVLTHGYVVDSQGHKMSKSLGNVVVPVDVAKNLGADILRLWVAGADYKLDINYSEEILKRTVDAYRRIRNTIRFLLANIFDFNPEKDLLPGEKLLALDRWAINQTATLQQEVIAAYSEYSFQTVYQKIHNFCSVQMGSFYLDIIKDRQYTSYRTGIPRRSAQTAMYHILESLVRCLAPILSFTAEEIWRYIPGERSESIFLSVWYDRFPFFKTGLQMDWSLLIPVRDAINKLLEQHRKNGDIGSALDAEVILYADDKLLSELSHLGDELRFVLITSSAKALPLHLAPPDAESAEIPGLFAKILVSENQKCVRCWQRRPDVGQNTEHPGLCGRCLENLHAPGEIRHYA